MRGFLVLVRLDLVLWENKKIKKQNIVEDIEDIHEPHENYGSLLLVGPKLYIIHILVLS